MNDFLGNSGYHAERLSGVPLSRLKSYIDNNTPVMIWATICMEPPIESDIWTVPETGREITWVYPMHALVLTGYDESGFYFMTLSPVRTSTTAKTAWRSPTPPFSSRPSS